MINDDQKSKFQDLFYKYKEYTIHQRNLQVLMIEIQNLKLLRTLLCQLCTPY